jgi:hypothetical protein
MNNDKVLMGFNFGGRQRCLNKFAKNNYLDKKFKEKEVEMGKGLH